MRAKPSPVLQDRDPESGDSGCGASGSQGGVPGLFTILGSSLPAKIRCSGRPQTQRVFAPLPNGAPRQDRKSTRLNSSHQIISYAVFCLKKKKTQLQHQNHIIPTSTP